MTFKVQGMKELEKVLAELGARAGKKALLGALRDAAKPVRKKMRELAPKGTGNLRRHIKTQAVTGKGATSNVATVMVGTFRGYGYNPAFYAQFIEFGTKKHLIKPKNTKSGKKKKTLSFGGKVYSSVIHPGQKAKPFIGPAFDATRTQALTTLSKRLRERIILEVIKKHGRNFN